MVLGGASTIGGVSLGYQYGISGMWLVFMLGLGIVALSILLSTRLAHLGVYTVSEMLALRYGPSSRLISAIVMAAYDLMVAAPQPLLSVRSSTSFWAFPQLGRSSLQEGSSSCTRWLEGCGP